MKFVFECGNEVFLPFVYDFCEEAKAFLDKTKVLDIRKVRDEGLTTTEQGKKNLKAMLYRICKEHPAETGALLDRMWITESEGEIVPNAAITLMRVMGNKDAMDFFTQLILSGSKFIGNL